MNRRILTTLLLTVIAPNLLGDDRDLLRATSSETYAFFLLDTSASMALTLDDQWVEGGADDPRSRLHIARSVLYELLADISGNIHYGFATFNQDELRITGKHWLYFPQDPDTITGSTAASAAAKAALATLATDLGYPNFEPLNEVEIPGTDSDGYPETTVRLDGDIMTFGTSFNSPATTGDCTNALDLTNAVERRTVSRYAKLGIDSITPTTIFVENGGITYRLTFKNSEYEAGLANYARLGDDTIDVDLTYQACGSATSTTQTVTFRKWREFLMTDDGQGLNFGGRSKKGTAEVSGGLWDYQDAQGYFSCGSGKPHGGEGWEGNYDTGRPFTTNPVYEASVNGDASDRFDTHCSDGVSAAAGCKTLFAPTSYDTSLNERELDRGDMLPMHWNFANKEAFLARINPNHRVDPSNPQFGSSFYFKDTPDATGRHQLKDEYAGAQPGDPPRYAPIVAGGVTPLAESLKDFQCWYTPPRDDGGRKCVNSPLSGIYNAGFQALLEQRAPPSFNCRRPVLIVISDAGTNCPGGAVVSSVAGLNSTTHSGPLSTGVSSWLFNLGQQANGPLDNTGKSLEVFVTNKQQLRAELQKVLGDLDKSLAPVASFTSAATPSVQADVEPRIYLTQFTPLAEEPVWEGRVLAFKKPLPIRDGKPDTSHPNYLWDAAEVLATHQAPKSNDVLYPYTRSELQLGAHQGTDMKLNRRILFAIEDSAPTVDGTGFRPTDGDTITDNDEDRKVPRSREIFGPANAPTLSGLSLNQVRKDLWKGLGVVSEAFTFPVPDDINDLIDLHSSKVEAAHGIFAHTSVLKQAISAAGDSIDYVMGDVFHATPLLVGGPSNSRYLARAGSGEIFEGYKDFFESQARRRKVLLVASNDNQLHAFDAGRFTGPIETGAFGTGTGLEIFAYTPRVLLPTVERIAQINAGHQWGVDGTPVAADVFIDPRHDGKGAGGSGPKAAERSWRTVVVGGLRRGGRGYYALDLTRPDKMVPKKDSTHGFDLGWQPQGGFDAVPGCFSSSGLPGSGIVENLGDCDLDYPSILWEFTDPDMGHSWSVPDIGAIRVTENDAGVIKYVAIFGGGADPNGLLSANDVESGNYVYMIDTETGKMLYKRRVEGAVPAAPAAVDTNQDGLLDRVYIGTTEGLMYRIDLDETVRLEIGGQCSATPAGSTDACCNDPDGPAYGCVSDAKWEPYVIFDTESDEELSNGARGPVRKPIFFRPAVVFVARLNSYALAFGTGNRDNLWSTAPPGGNRLYVISDDTDTLDRATDLPRYETDYQNVTAPPGIDQDPLVDPDDGHRGYYIKLGVVQSTTVLSTEDITFDHEKPTDCQQADGQNDCNAYTIQDDDVANEKLIAAPTAVSGLTVFSTFVPANPFYSFGNGENEKRRCVRRGVSRMYTNFTISGEPVCTGSSCAPLCDPSTTTCAPTSCDPKTDPSCRRIAEVDNLVSAPFIEEATTPCPESEGMAETLMEQLFPPTCNFASYRWNLSTVRADTGALCLAQIPVCIVEKNWRDY